MRDSVIVLKNTSSSKDNLDCVRPPPLAKVLPLKKICIRRDAVYLGNSLVGKHSLNQSLPALCHLFVDMVHQYFQVFQIWECISLFQTPAIIVRT